MRTKLIIGGLLLVTALAAWRLAHQFGGLRASPVNLEMALGRRLLSELAAQPVTRVLVVGYETQPGIPDFAVRLDGMRQAAKDLKLDPAALTLELWPIDPMDAQNGKPGFTFAQLAGLLEKHPDCDGVILMLDIAQPVDPAWRARGMRRPRVCLLAFDERSKPLLDQQAVDVLFYYRSATAPGPAPALTGDPAHDAIEQAFAILRRP